MPKKKSKQTKFAKIKKFISEKKKTFIIVAIVLGVLVIGFSTIAGLSYSPAKKTYSEAMAGKEKFELAQNQITEQKFRRCA